MTSSGKVIGNIYCGNRDFDAKEAGYIINKNYQRQGFAEEALSAVIEDAFRKGASKQRIRRIKLTNYQEINAAFIDRWIEEGVRFIAMRSMKE